MNMRVDEQAVKKVRLDEDAKVEAKVAEDVKKVKIDEGAASEVRLPRSVKYPGYLLR